MNATLGEPSAWTSRKRWLVIVFFIGLQLLMIVWLSERAPLHPRKAAAHPAILLAAHAQNDILPLTDPTLFPSTHPDGFSGLAWLNVAPHGYLPRETGAAPQLLSIEPDGFGDIVGSLPNVKTPITLGPIGWIAQISTLSDAAPVAAFPTNSVVTLSRGTTARGLLSVPPLKSWPCDDVLPPSVVQVLIDKRGVPISAVLLTTCGFKPADVYAVDMARTALFEPASDTASGSLVFHWHTLPATGNGAAIMP
jgi:hypothetical protein